MLDFVHPQEREIFSELKKQRLFNLLLGALTKWNESGTSMALIPDRSFVVTDKTFPRLHNIYLKAKDKLEFKRDCNVFCTTNYECTAKTVGTADDALIVIDSTCLETFTDEQLLALISRELAHIKLDHVKYLTTFSLIDTLAGFLPGFIANTGLLTIKGLLFEWTLAANYSADRASALVVGDIMPVIKNNLISAGLEKVDDDYRSYLRDNPEQFTFGRADRAVKILLSETLKDFPIPFVMERVRELVRWSESAKPFTSAADNSRVVARLCKGQRFSLSLEQINFAFRFGCGDEASLEIDMAAFLTDKRGKVSNDEDFVFYGNARHKSGSVKYNDGEIEIDLSRIPCHIEKISVTTTIYDAEKRRQNFSMIRNARLKVSDLGGELVTFPQESFTVETAIVLGEVYRYKGEWKFKAVGSGYKGGLIALCKDFGVEVRSTTE